MPRLPRSSFVGGRDRARRFARGGRAGLRADRRLLGLRLPEGALGGVRAARLPVDLAAGALRPGVPVRAAERAADGLLPARLTGARGPAAGDGGARALRAASVVEMHGRGAVAGGASWARVRERRAPRTTCAALVAERERGRSASRSLGDLAARSGAAARGARAARLGGGVRLARATGGRGGAAAGALAARRREPGTPCRTERSSRCRSTRTKRRRSRPVALGADARRLRLDQGHAARAPARADAPGHPARTCTSAPGERSRDGAARAGRRPGRGPPAPGHGQGHHVHAARGRARDDQPDRPAAGDDAAGWRCGRSRSCSPRTARAPRGDTNVWSTRSGASSGPTCRAARSRHIEPARLEHGGGGRRDLREDVPAAHSAAAAGASGGCHAAEEADLRAVGGGPPAARPPAAGGGGRERGFDGLRAGAPPPACLPPRSASPLPRAPPRSSSGSAARPCRLAGAPNGPAGRSTPLPLARRCTRGCRRRRGA